MRFSIIPHIHYSQEHNDTHNIHTSTHFYDILHTIQPERPTKFHQIPHYTILLIFI